MLVKRVEPSRTCTTDRCSCRDYIYESLALSDSSFAAAVIWSLLTKNILNIDESVVLFLFRKRWSFVTW